MQLPPAPRKNVYRISKVVRVLTTCVLVPVLAFFLIGPVWMLVDSPSEAGFWWIILLSGIGLGGLVVFQLRATYRASLELRPDGLLCTKGWGPPREVRFAELAGFRSGPSRNNQGLFLVYRDKTRKPFRIDLVYEQSHQLARLLREKLPDLDQDSIDTAMKEILNDTRLGATAALRRDALRRARKLARYLNGAAIVLLIWAIAIPEPYDLVLILTALLPLVTLVLLRVSHGLLTLESKKTDVRPGVAYALIGPGTTLAMRALIDWHILDWAGFWIPFSLLAGALFSLAWFILPFPETGRLSQHIAVVFFSLLHSFGLVLFLNCAFDHTSPDLHHSTVQSRHISHGKHTSYYLTMRPWLDGVPVKQVDVGSSVYNRHPEGSDVLIGVRPGTLAIRWFFVR